MTLRDRLQDDLKTAMRSKDETRKSVIRMVRAAIQNEEIGKRAELDDDSVVTVLTQKAKQHRESIEAFGLGNRQDLVDKEEAELAIVMEYLPEQMSADEITALAKAAIGEVDPAGPQDMGKVMGRLMPQLKGKADGKAVSGIVTGLLKDL